MKLDSFDNSVSVGVELRQMRVSKKSSLSQFKGTTD